MKEYHKIETLFKRDMDGNKKLIEGTFRNPAIEYLKDCEWIFTEKVDGTNVRVHWDGHRVSFGGRTDNAQLPTPLLDRLNILFGGSDNEELFEQKFGETIVTLYGEGFGDKIQSGGGYRKYQDFVLFDVLVGDTWLERENIKDIATAFNVSVAPIILRGTIQDAVDYVKHKPLSIIAHDTSTQSEGLVGVPARGLMDRLGNRIIVKIKVRDFL